MYFYKIFSFNFFMFFLLLLNGMNADENIRPRVAGGSPATNHPLAKHVAYIKADEGVYAGTIISPKTLVTLAQCCFVPRSLNQRDPGSLGIYTGRTDADVKCSPQKAVSCMANKRYAPACTASGDIGVIKLKQPIEFDSVRTAPIPLAKSRPAEGTKCTVLGWGSPGQGGGAGQDPAPAPGGAALRAGPASNLMHFADVTVAKDEQCSLVVEYAFCAAGKVPDANAICEADAGGPLICDDKLTGITSSGTGKCGDPRVYTDVAHFRKWVAAASEGTKFIVNLKLITPAFILAFFYCKKS